MIKKILLTLGIFGIGLINITFGYNVIDDCFRDSSNNNSIYSCVDLELGENYNFYGNSGIGNTINNGFSFISNGNDQYFYGKYYDSIKNWNSFIIGFFNEDGYFNTINLFNNLDGTIPSNKRYSVIYSGMHYCIINDTTQNINFKRCGVNYVNYLLTYNNTIEDTLQFIEGENIIGRRIWYRNPIIYAYATQYGICALYSNNKAICLMPLGSPDGYAINCSINGCVYSGVNVIKTNTGYTLDYVLNNLDDFGYSQSPFGFGGLIDPIPENGFSNTNRGVFDSYAEQGYVLSRCYSDFSLDNLAIATGGIYQFYETELDDGVYYTGATVLDLFVEYGYGNSFESFFDYWYQTYNQSLINDSPAKYVGLSKGLWNMSNKYYYAGLSNKYVDYTKFYNYCSYFVNFDGDWDAEYTGPQLPNDVANQLAPSQSAIDYLSGFIHNQLSSGNNQNFDADTFFTSLTTKFDRLLNNINGSFVGIIPGYILAIMMALIFIRIISH